MTTHQLDDPFVRRFVGFLVHLRRYRVWYGVTVAWAVVLVAVPAFREGSGEPAATAGPDVAMGVPAPGDSPAASAARLGTSVGDVAGISSGFEAPLPGDLATVSGSFDEASNGSGDAAGRSTPDFSPGSDVDSGDVDAPAPPSDIQLGSVVLPGGPSVPLPALPAEIVPVLGAAGPTIGVACDNVGFAALLAGVAGPAVAPQIGPAMGNLVPVYVFCGAVPRPATKADCPNPTSEVTGPVLSPAGVPAPPNPVGAAVDQAAATEGSAGASGTVSGPIGGALGCSPG